MSTFGIYIAGYVIFIAGLVWGLHLLGLPPVWIAVIGLIFTGIGIVTGVGKTRQKDHTDS